MSKPSKNKTSSQANNEQSGPTPQQVKNAIDTIARIGKEIEERKQRESLQEIDVTSTILSSKDKSTSLTTSDRKRKKQAKPSPQSTKKPKNNQGIVKYKIYETFDKIMRAKDDGSPKILDIISDSMDSADFMDFADQLLQHSNGVQTISKAINASLRRELGSDGIALAPFIDPKETKDSGATEQSNEVGGKLSSILMSTVPIQDLHKRQPDKEPVTTQQVKIKVKPKARSSEPELDIITKLEDLVCTLNKIPGNILFSVKRSELRDPNYQIGIRAEGFDNQGPNKTSVISRNKLSTNIVKVIDEKLKSIREPSSIECKKQDLDNSQRTTASNSSIAVGCSKISLSAENKKIVEVIFDDGALSKLGGDGFNFIMQGVKAQFEQAITPSQKVSNPDARKVSSDSKGGLLGVSQ